jgi:hypothetical protein
VNRLRSAGLVDADENPDPRRSPLIRMTEVGAARYAALDRRQIRWINELAAGLAHTELATTARVLQCASSARTRRSAPPPTGLAGERDVAVADFADCLPSNEHSMTWSTAGTQSDSSRESPRTSGLLPFVTP